MNHESLRIAFIIICLAVVSSAHAPVQDNTFAKLVDEYVMSYVKNGDFSGNVLVAKGNKTIFNKSYGKSNYELNVPMQGNARFRIASVSKTFTAAAIVLLNNSKLLSYSDKLSKYVPGFINADSITILHLLLHQSGIADIEYDKYALDRLSLSETIGTISSKPLYFKSGTNSRYSNSGYMLLAYIIEKASGMSYAKYLEEKIFSKVGMKDTGVEHFGNIITNKATGYGIGTGSTGIAPASWYDINMEVGSGSIYSTVEDLLKWLHAINDNVLFEMKALPYPFGWGVREKFKGKKSIEQSGFLNGYSSYVALYPSEDIFIIALSNISSSFNEQSGQDLAAVYFKEEYKVRELRIPVKLTNIESYTGKYLWPGYKEFLIEPAGDGIQWRFTDEKTGSPLAPVAENVFLLRLMNSTITFKSDGNKKAPELTFTSGKDKTVCKRIE